MLFSKQHCFIGYLILSFITSTGFATEIYRSVDDRGRITYSDIPSTGAQKLDIISQPGRHLHDVARVYDGDTIILTDKKQIRLLGINTPEIESRLRAEEPGGVVAKKWLQAQLQENKVYLEYDQTKRDKYKRLLAHVFTPDGKHINQALLENGLAFVSIIPPNIRYSDKLIQAQLQAEKQKLGIWSMPDYQPKPIEQIANHNKGWQRFTGIPASIKKSRKYTRLMFDDKIDIRIQNTNLDLFPALNTYVGKSLEIRGWVSRNKDHYTVLIQHPSALIIR
ncbi:thermonuclease family protein [Nitrosomonas ureae]|uniref:Endonuclease YncB, thermonuclease family n=1 Tax=Nitrosomonas ureae TaxID=44577 RepID=A0A1H9AAZ7_9PROT|nr:thermonuclease family protein [Nitrosomonas ureae]SEP73178.1 Endonuclease YncB, thermonuclease family [Nitrosomonas ureae]